MVVASSTSEVDSARELRVRRCSCCGSSCYLFTPKEGRVFVIDFLPPPPPRVVVTVVGGVDRYRCGGQGARA